MLGTLRPSLFFTAVLVPLFALGSGNTCLYDGKKHDDRYGKLEHFTGEFTCNDMDTGKLTSREKHTDGKRDGAFSKYDSRTGELEEEGFYKDDKYDGVRKVYHKGKLSQEYAYEGGKVLGVQKSYEDGILHRVYLMVDGQNTADTDFSLNKKGQLMQLQCGSRQIGRKDGEWCGRYAKQSTVSLYTEDGKLSATEQYLWGKRHGTSKKFNVASGKLMREENYENGASLKDGQKNYDKSGAVLSKTDCDSSRKNCTETDFFEGGEQKKLVVKYAAGKRVSENEFYQNGKPRREILRTGDSFKITEYFDSGVVSSKGTYAEAIDWYWDPYIPNGVVEYFSPEGILSGRNTYKNGRLEGKCDYYWKLDGHDIHEESDFEKGRVVKRKIYVDKLPVSEAEYMPDGSVKSQKRLKKSPVEGLVI
ncbi:MAG: hypothetical protein ABL958_17165 [Bdellovibrionia bacterium]